jgi:hypothetical protein
MMPPLSRGLMARYQRNRRRRNKRAKKCTECGRERAAGKKKCEACLGYQRQWYSDNYSRPRERKS